MWLGNIISGILVLWLLVGYWWDEVQNRWDPSHFMPSQTPTNHPSQFFWHCHNSVPKWKVSNKIIFERIIESKSFILNRNLAFICQLFGNWQGESVKNGYFMVRLTVRGGGHTGQVGATTTCSQNKHVGEFLYFKLPKLPVQVKSRSIKDVTKYVLNTDVQFTN